MTGIEIAAAIAAVAAVAGTAMSAVASSNQSKYQAAVAENEAIETQQQADFETQRLKERRDRVLSAQRAQVGASGIDLEGSPLLVMEDTAAQSELDALMIQHSATSDIAKLRSQAAMERLTGKSALAIGGVKAGAQILNGYTTIAGYSGDTPDATKTQTAGDPYAASDVG